MNFGGINLLSVKTLKKIKIWQFLIKNIQKDMIFGFADIWKVAGYFVKSRRKFADPRRDINLGAKTFQK